MNKKKIILPIVMSLALVGCQKGNDNKIEDDKKEPEIQNPEPEKPDKGEQDKEEIKYSSSLELFNLSVNHMKNLSYEKHELGESNTTALGLFKTDLVIYELLQHTPTELYFEKVSSGAPAAGQTTSFAEAAYISSNVARRKSASNHDGYGDPVNDRVIVNNWGDSYDSTSEGIGLAFGINEDSYTNFTINSDTIKEEDNIAPTLTNVDGNNVYHLHFNLNIKPETVKSYARQVETMSKKRLKSIESIVLDIYINEDLTVNNFVSKEHYSVYAFDKGNLAADVNNTLKYSFKYFEDGKLNVNKI